MRNIFLFAATIAVIALGGCATRPSDAIGTGEGGRPVDVDHGGSAGDTGQELRLVPLSKLPMPTFAEIKGPEVMHVWLPPRKSLDGLTWREGVWAHRVVRYYTWGQEDLLQRGSVSLKEADNFDEETQVIQARTPMRVDPQPEMAGLISAAYSNPRTPYKVKTEPRGGAAASDTGTGQLQDIPKILEKNLAPSEKAP